MLMTHAKAKLCPSCKAEKPVSEFYRRGRGYSSYCKKCAREIARESSRQRVVDGRDRISKIKYEKSRGHFRTGSGAQKRLTAIELLSSELFWNAKKRSLYGGKPFDLTKEYIAEIVAEFCESNYHVITKKKHPFKPSLDRIDNGGGYTKDNVIVSWQIENYCKNTFSEADVIEFCKRKLGLL